MIDYPRVDCVSGSQGPPSRLPRILRKLAVSTSGSLSLEWILLSTVIVLSAIAALGTARDALVNEFGDLSIAITTVNQSFTVGGRRPASFVDTSKSPP